MSNQFSPKNQFSAKPQMQASEPATSGKAVTTLVLGILSLGFSCLTAIPALIVGFMALGEINRSRGQIGGKGLAITGMVLSLITPLFTLVIGGILFALLMPAVQQARGAARSVSSMNNLKQMSLAMHNYHDVHKSFPYAGTDEVPMSWRVSLLPYLEEMALYDQFDFNQPADSAVNSALAARMPEIYGTPLFDHPADRSPFQVPIAPQSAKAQTPQGQHVSMQSDFVGPKKVLPAKLASFIDGTSNTALIVVAKPERLDASWTRTEADYAVDLNNPAAGLYETPQGTYLIVTADGAVHQVDGGIDPQTLSNILTRDDGQPIYDGL